MHDTEKLLRKLIVATALFASAALWWPAPASAVRLQSTSVTAVPVAAQMPLFAQPSGQFDATVSPADNTGLGAAAR